MFYEPGLRKAMGISNNSSSNNNQGLKLQNLNEINYICTLKMKSNIFELIS